MFIQLFTSHEHAADVGADLDMLFAQRLSMKHRVIPDHFVHMDWLNPHTARDFLDQFLRDMAELVLSVEEHWNHGRTLSSFGVNSQQARKFLFKSRRKRHIS